MGLGGVAAGHELARLVGDGVVVGAPDRVEPGGRGGHGVEAVVGGHVGATVLRRGNPRVEGATFRGGARAGRPCLGSRVGGGLGGGGDGVVDMHGRPVDLRRGIEGPAHQGVAGAGDVVVGGQGKDGLGLVVLKGVVVDPGACALLQGQLDLIGLVEEEVGGAGGGERLGGRQGGDVVVGRIVHRGLPGSVPEVGVERVAHEGMVVG